MHTGTYSFPALRLHQGEHTYYLIHCPLRLLPRLLLFDELEVPAPIRQAQWLDPAAVARWTRYLSAHQADYLLPPLIVSVDGALRFEPLTQDHPSNGQLHLALEARLLIRDGQHRRAAIQALLASASALADDTMPLMLIPDPQFSRAIALYRELHPSQVRATTSMMRRTLRRWCGNSWMKCRSFRA